MIILFIALWTIAGILIITDPKTRSTRWGSAIAFFSGFGGLGVLLRNYADTLSDIILKQNIYTFVSFGFTLSHQVAPYALMVYGIVYSGLFQKYKLFLKFVPFIFFIPVAIMYLIIPFIPEYNPSFLILSLWVVPYVFASNLLLVNSLLKEKNKRIKQQRLFTCLVITPATMYCVAANYIFRIFGIHNLWQYNAVIIALAFGIFIFSSIRYGVMGVKVKFETYNFENTLKAMTSGTAILNHTLKNEILTISLGLDNIKSNTNYTNLEVMESINTINEATKHMLEMVSRIQEQVRDININENYCDFITLIESSLKTVNPYKLKKNIQVKKLYRENESIMLLCDELLIKEVLCNVFKNAIEAIKENGELVVDIVNDKKRILISIQDNGIGISKENLSHVIDPFFTTKKYNLNFGLGLSYCYNVMSKHGGSLKIISEEHKGTTVSLVFPNSRKYIDYSNINKKGIAT